VRPEILFPAYLAGFNLIEAFYMALPHLSWQAVVVGDPLCQPFARPSLTRAEIEEPNDTSTQLPGLFSKRRLESARASARNIDPKALALAVLAETLQARGDEAGARKALEDATALAPALTGSHLTLAMSYAESGEHEKSIERYRVLLKLQPNNLVVLNNLAYALAVHQKQPADALPLARRAATLAPSNASVLDTLGWVEHLTGDHNAAAKVLSQAVRLAPTNGEIRLHAAIVYAELGDLAQAGTELSEALRLDPELGKRDEVSQLRSRMKKK
jgi:Tfp pilus assembly protein PilF